MLQNGVQHMHLIVVSSFF